MKVRIDNNVNIFTLTDFDSNNRISLSYSRDTQWWEYNKAGVNLKRSTENETLSISYNKRLFIPISNIVSGVKVNVISEDGSSSIEFSTDNKYLLYLLDNKKDLYLYGHYSTGGIN